MQRQGDDPAGLDKGRAGVLRPRAAEGTWQLLRAGFLAVFATVVLGSCAYMPVAVDGIAGRPDAGAQSADNPWIFVPVGAWITRESATPVSVGVCADGVCPNQIAVAVVDLRGAEARALARSLAAPSGLVARLDEGNRRRRALVAAALRRTPPAIAARRMLHRTTASARPIRHRNFSGFTMTMRRAGDRARDAHAVVFGRQRGAELRVVVVIGARAAQVEAAARSAAEANL